MQPTLIWRRYTLSVFKVRDSTPRAYMRIVNEPAPECAHLCVTDEYSSTERVTLEWEGEGIRPNLCSSEMSACEREAS